MADNGTTLAKAYIQLVPSAEGLGNAITAEFEDAGDKAGEAGGKRAGSKFTAALGVAARVAGAALAAAGTAVGAVVSSAVQSFSEYEQLAGGAQLMFGDAYDAVAERAANAYKTVQMSQNDYLSAVNGFATGLKTSLGGDEQAAADLADKIITAQADIVAATGNSQEAVQNAFAGIMRGNFTMLDNLQLGITPTTEGFQEVIDKVNEWNAAQGNATDYQMGNLADMESALVDYVAMVGMSGYAQEEAAGTIQGSLASTKAAWDNLLVGMASGEGDMDALIGGLVESASGLLENLIPVLESSLQGIAQLLESAAPMIVDMLPGLVETILPGLVESATSIVTSLVEVLPSLLQTVITALIGMTPQLVQAGITLFVGLIGALPEIISSIVAALPQIIGGIVSALIAAQPELTMAGIELFLSLIANLPAIIAGVVAAIPQIIESLVSSITGSSGQIKEAALQLMMGFKQGITESVTQLWEAMKAAVSSIIDGAKRLLGIASPSKVFAEIGGYTMQGFAEGILRNEGLVADAMDSASKLATGTFASTLQIDASAGSATPGLTTAAVAREMANALRGVRVVIDGQRTIGYLTPGIDNALGVRQAAALRGTI
jgi:hypothetical protein